MIDIFDKKDCCGCFACLNICAHNCIAMEEDEEGFLYPLVDTAICTDCKMCEKVCPNLAESDKREPIVIFAAKNNDDDIREQSSSGGIFSIFAEQILAEGGVVFGAKFDKEWEVMHSFSETQEELAEFRGSKYVQSRIGNSYAHAKKFLMQGRKVLFSGTPCQIAGLRLFLRKDFENLLTIDFICHGTPSPLVWRRYLDKKGKETLKELKFRNKKYGWKQFSLSLTKEIDNKSVEYAKTLNEDTFLRGFLRDLYLRPSCHQCPVKDLRSGSNITIADFWGIDATYPEQDDDRGYSLVLLNDDKALDNYKHVQTNLFGFEIGYDLVKKFNKAIYVSAIPHKRRGLFFSQLSENKDIEQLIEKEIKLSVMSRFEKLTRKCLRKLRSIIFNK